MIQEINNPSTTGIVNSNNNCYISSILQCLSYSFRFLEYIVSNEFDEDIREDLEGYEISLEIRKNLSLLWMNNLNQPLDLHHFISLFSQYLFKNRNTTGITIGSHNDANEFLNIIIDLLDKYLGFEPKISISIKNRNLSSYDKVCLNACNTWKTHFKDNYSKIVELFYGQFVSEIKNNEEISHSFDPFNIITLEIPEQENSPSIEDCIEKFMSKEKINDSLEKKFYIWKSPEVLIISLKRFDHNQQKNEKKIIYKDTLDLSKYCKGNKRENIVYKLVSICCHQGTMNYGHYFTLAKKENSHSWYKLDDTSISKITDNDIIPLTSSAYILFYELQK